MVNRKGERELGSKTGQSFSFVQSLAVEFGLYNRLLVNNGLPLSFDLRLSNRLQSAFVSFSVTTTCSVKVFLKSRTKPTSCVASPPK